MSKEWSLDRWDLGELPQLPLCDASMALCQRGNEPSAEKNSSLVAAAKIAGKKRQCKAKGTNLTLSNPIVI